VGDKSKCFAVADINFLSVLTVVDECGTSFGAVYLDGDAKFIAAANPAVINELLDRLEAAEADALEQARLNGMGASREAALMAKLEAAEKDIAMKERINDSLGSTLNAVANERDDLLARIEAMEKQEPVAWMDRNGTLYNSVSHVRASDKPLYTAPGAQPAPSVPEGWKLVPIEPTPEMIMAMVSHYRRLGVAWRAALEAAPEAKP
jgi:hypothetical protein